MIADIGAVRSRPGGTGGFAGGFGTRHIDATAHQGGLILAVAAESRIKPSRSCGRVFVTFDVQPCRGRAQPRDGIRTPRPVLTQEPVWSTLITMTLLSSARDPCWCPPSFTSQS